MTSRFNPSIIQPYFFPATNRMLINYGKCFEWAWIAYHLFEGVELWSCQIHAFIKYQDKFYDSECLEGTKNYRRLRCIKEYKGTLSARRMKEDEFVSYWSVFNSVYWGHLKGRAVLARSLPALHHLTTTPGDLHLEGEGRQ